jgi:hypothetical protein
MLDAILRWTGVPLYGLPRAIDLICSGLTRRLHSALEVCAVRAVVPPQGFLNARVWSIGSALQLCVSSLHALH